MMRIIKSTYIIIYNYGIYIIIYYITTYLIVNDVGYVG